MHIGSEGLTATPHDLSTALPVPSRAVQARLAAARRAIRGAWGSPATRTSLVIVAEAVTITWILAAVTTWPWPWVVLATVALLVGAWLPLGHLVLKPARSRLTALEGELATIQATAAERDMMLSVLEESESRLRTIFDNSPNGVVVVDLDTTLPIDFNDTMPRMLGYSRGEFASVAMDRYAVEDEDGQIRARLERVLRGGSEQFTARCRTRVGETFDASFSAQAVTVAGSPAISCIVRDISQQQRAEQDLRVTHDKMQAMISELERRNQERAILTEMGGVLQACVALSEAFIAVSRFGARLFPTTAGALYVYTASRTDLELAAEWNTLPGGFDEVLGPEDCWSLRRGRLYDRTDCATGLACHHVGEGSDASYLCMPLTAQGETLGFLHLRAANPQEAPDGAAPLLVVDKPLVFTIADQVTLGLANLRLRDTLRQQSIHDSLTGLFNRRYMEETLRREIPRAIRGRSPLAVVMADIDHFKRFNDTYGHEAGDAILAEIGLLLKSSVRAGDIPCRYGGEEFALVLPGATLAHTIERVEAIRHRVSQLRVQHLDTVLGGLTLSLGVAVLPQHGTAPDELLRAADKALYRAKEEGRDRARVADDPPA